MPKLRLSLYYAVLLSIYVAASIFAFVTKTLGGGDERLNTPAGFRPAISNTELDICLCF